MVILSPRTAKNVTRYTPTIGRTMMAAQEQASTPIARANLSGTFPEASSVITTAMPTTVT